MRSNEPGGQSPGIAPLLDPHARQPGGPRPGGRDRAGIASQASRLVAAGASRAVSTPIEQPGSNAAP